MTFEEFWKQRFEDTRGHPKTINVRSEAQSAWNAALEEAAKSVQGHSTRQAETIRSMKSGVQW